ncbi:MAG: glycosyltransferase family 2 protein [Candidatus Obscuribacterales bacterium]|nr:glycosyltransferase family 2 protein [Candidatus Obscuribacterales bacterium]
MSNLSVVIIAKDEERTIGQVLAAVQDLQPEIILVDSGSTDATPKIAADHGAKVIHQDWLGYSDQKNFALDQASNEWVLSLDADEIITPKLVSEIKQVLENPLCDGYRIKRLMFIAEHPIKYGGFYPDAQLRLFRRGKGRFNGRLVHESIKLEGKVCDLQNHLLHYAYKDVEQFEQAMEKYAQLSAQESLRSGFNPSKTSLLNLFLHPLWTFFYRYLFRLGFMDGILGLRMAIIYAGYVQKKIAYLKDAVKQNG